MYRFYSENADFKKTSIIIRDANEIHHIKDVLRLKKGAKIQIFNGASQEADVVLEQIKEVQITAAVQQVRQLQEGAVKIVLACAPPKKGKFEMIIEKCTELGVDEIIPLNTKRTEVVFPEDRMGGKLKRFEAVAINASKQSKRMKVPVVHPMQTLNQVLKALEPKGLHLFPSLHGHATQIKDAIVQANSPKIVTIFIGPEGDFTPDEVKLASDHGCVLVSLGASVLKVETAAIASVALVRFLCTN